MTVPQGEKTVTDDEIISALEEHPDPAFTTPELAEMFGMTAEGIRGRMDKLAESGGVERKKPTARTVMWWVQSDESEPLVSK